MSVESTIASSALALPSSASGKTSGFAAVVSISFTSSGEADATGESLLALEAASLASFFCLKSS